MQGTESTLLGFLVVTTILLLVLAAFFTILVVVFNKNIQKKHLEIFRTTIETQEQERKRIGRDLHDEMGPLLSAAKIQLELLKEPHSLDIGILADYQKLLDEAITSMRNTAQALVPDTLYHFGLIVATNELCNKLNSPTCPIVFTYDELPVFDIPVQLNLYRIIQELLNNAIRHAHAKHLKIKFINKERVWVLVVEDDGIGVDMQTAVQLTGMGLKNIQNRVMVLHGKLYFKSQVNKGTLVEVVLYKDKL